MSAAVAQYQQALRNMDAARDRLRSLAKTVQRVAGTLQGWEAVEPDSINGHLDQALRDWPSGEDVNRAVAEWKNAVRKVRAAWDVIQAEDTIGLKAPEEYKPAAEKGHMG